MLAGAIGVWEGLGRSFRQTWRGSVFRGVAQPFLYFVAFGLGVGALAGDIRTSASATVSYLEWMALGLLVASAFQIGASEGSTQVVVGFVWDKTFRMALHAPISVVDLALGLVLWANFRALLTTGPMAVLFVAMGAIGWDEAMLLLVVSVLAASIGAVLLASVGTRVAGAAWLSVVGRYVVTPLVLLSGSVFPLDVFPPLAAGVLRALPVGATVELARGAVGSDGSVGFGLALSTTWLLVGSVLLVRGLQRRKEE